MAFSSAFSSKVGASSGGAAMASRPGKGSTSISCWAAATRKSRNLPGLLLATYRVRGISEKQPEGSLHSEAADRNDACPRQPPVHGIRLRAERESLAGPGQMRYAPTLAAGHTCGPGPQGR